MSDKKLLKQKNAGDQDILSILEQVCLQLYPGRKLPPLRHSTRLDSDLGIDSLARMELLDRLERHLQQSLDAEALIRAETVADVLAISEQQHESATGKTTSAAALQESVQLNQHAGFPINAQTLVEALAWHHRSQGDNPYLYYYAGDIDQPEIISYATFWQESRNVAAGLRYKAIAPGQSVALMLPTGTEFLYSFFGILMAGAVPVPLYPPQRLNQIEEHLKRQVKILENSEAVALITVAEARHVSTYLKARLPELRHVLHHEDLQNAPATEIIYGKPESVAFMQYTSGSTGTPKGVVLTHANLLANIRCMGQALQVTAQDRFTSWLPLYHDMGLIGAFLGSIYHGFPLILMPPLSFIARPQRWLQAISKHQATLTAAPNFAYEISVKKIRDRDIEGVDLSSLRLCCNGAEPVSHTTIEKFRDRFATHGLSPTALVPVYGLAENSVGLSFPPMRRGMLVDYIDADTLQKKQVARAVDRSHKNALAVVSCGTPIPQHEVRIVDQQNHELSEREIGLLQFRGPSTTQGYYRNPEANATLLQGDWRNSGDYAYIAAGEIYITGRSKDLIIRAGRNLYPYDLEQAVGDLDGIVKGNVAVFGSRDPQHGDEKLVVLAETRERQEDKREKLKQRIGELSMDLLQLPPDEIVLAPLRTVLKTSSGKIRRLETRALYESGRVGESKSVSRQIINLAVTALLPFVKSKARSFLRHLYIVYAWTLFFVTALAGLPLLLLSPGQIIPRAIVKTWLRIIMPLLGIRYRVQGKDNIPKGQACIVAANHASYIDVLAIGLSLPANYGFVAKKELSRVWIMRVLLKKFNTHYIDRVDIKQSLEQTRDIVDHLHKGDSVVFFPEGTFTRAPGLRPFKMGAFVAATNTGLPILPIAVHGTRNVLRGDEWRPRPGRLTLTIMPLLSSTHAGSDNEWEAAIRLRDQTRELILQHCGEPDLNL